jgi:rare lipoprotein A (peptidoglycan hydrolase)
MRNWVTLGLMLFTTPAFAEQTLRATWYGHELAGRRTASGERFNPNGRTAARGPCPLVLVLLSVIREPGERLLFE